VPPDRMCTVTGMPLAAIAGCAWEPVRITGLEGAVRVRSVSATRAHSLAISDDSRLYSWGVARYGVLGIDLSVRAREGEVCFQVEPRMVHALREWRVLACAAGGSHSLAICSTRGGGLGSIGAAAKEAPLRRGDAAGAAFPPPSGPETPTFVFAWGLASAGRLGIPVESLLASIANPAFGESWSATSRGGGRGGGAGTPTLPSPLRSSLRSPLQPLITGANAPPMVSLERDEFDGEPFVALPTHLAALDGRQVVHISAGADHSLASSAAGECFGWGLATSGRLGLGMSDGYAATGDSDGAVFVEQPRLLRGLSGYRVCSVAAGDTNSLACTADGQLLSWGSAAHGKLGFGQGALGMPTDADGEAYQPMPRQLWLQDMHGELDDAAQDSSADGGQTSGGGKRTPARRRGSLTSVGMGGGISHTGSTGAVPGDLRDRRNQLNLFGAADGGIEPKGIDDGNDGAGLPDAQKGASGGTPSAAREKRKAENRAIGAFASLYGDAAAAVAYSEYAPAEASVSSDDDESQDALHGSPHDEGFRDNFGENADDDGQM
jgi:hypothetical protein